MDEEIDDETTANALNYGPKSKRPKIHPAMTDPADPEDLLTRDDDGYDDESGGDNYY
jgi:hypothetical protein